MLQEHGPTRIDQVVASFRACWTWLETPRRAPGCPGKPLAVHLLDHMLDDPGVLMLRAEHDDLGVLIDPNVVARRPVEKVVC